MIRKKVIKANTQSVTSLRAAMGVIVLCLYSMKEVKVVVLCEGEDWTEKEERKEVRFVLGLLVDS